MIGGVEPPDDQTRLLAAALTAPALRARRRFERSRLSAITDEIGKTPDESLAFAKEYGLQWIELRNVPGKGKEYIYLEEPELKAAAASFREHGVKVSFLNSSLMKYPWPGIDPAPRKQDTEAAMARRKAAGAARYEKRMDDLGKALHAAQILGVDKLRVFTGTRAAEPEKVYPRIADIIGEMAFVAEREKIHLLIENEGSCNVATSAESAAMMKLISSRWVGLNWDPQNAISRETPFPDGYATLPKKRILNVQFKGKGIMPDSKEKLDWKAILQALDRDGYRYCVGLETHIFDGTLIQAANISMKEMQRIVGEL
jgi:L-ribulose-5-phosphate 3-epimerase